VCCISRFFIQIKVPPSSETVQTYWINLQATFDYKYRFIYSVISKPGEGNYIAAFRKTQFSQMIQKLPLRTFWQCICLLWVFTKPIFRFANKWTSKTYIYFLFSQLMICKEQAFGFMTTKWRSLRQPLQVCLKYVGKLFMWITRLHNFCINEGYV